MESLHVGKLSPSPNLSLVVCTAVVLVTLSRVCACHAAVIVNHSVTATLCSVLLAVCAPPLQDHLVFEGMAWVDNQDGETQYWFPGFFGDLK